METLLPFSVNPPKMKAVTQALERQRPFGRGHSCLSTPICPSSPEPNSSVTHLIQLAQRTFQMSTPCSSFDQPARQSDLTAPYATRPGHCAACGGLRNYTCCCWRDERKVLFMLGVILFRSSREIVEKQVRGLSVKIFVFLKFQPWKLIPPVRHKLFSEGTFFPEGGASLQCREAERKTRQVRRRRRRWWEKRELVEKWRVGAGGYYEWRHIDSCELLAALVHWGGLAVKVSCALLGQERSHLTFDLSHFLCVGAADHQAVQLHYVWYGVGVERRRRGTSNQECDSQRTSWSLTLSSMRKILETSPACACLIVSVCVLMWCNVIIFLLWITFKYCEIHETSLWNIQNWRLLVNWRPFCWSSN